MGKLGWMGALLVLVGGLATADTIIIDGVVLEDVYVRQSRERYYVIIPSEGRVVSVAKSQVDEDSVLITQDESQRAALLQEWKKNKARLRASSTAVLTPTTMQDRNDAEYSVSSPTTEHLRQNEAAPAQAQPVAPLTPEQVEQLALWEQIRAEARAALREQIRANLQAAAERGRQRNAEKERGYRYLTSADARRAYLARQAPPAAYPYAPGAA